MAQSIALIVLAAGQGTRMKSDLPKVLHEIAGAPMVIHALRCGAAVAPERHIVVAGHGAEAVTRAVQDYNPDVQVVLQTEQLGTGHAVDQARDALSDFDGISVVLFGDTPLVGEETIKRLVDATETHDVVVLGFHADPASKYGRLIMDGDDLTKIVEWKDASEAERAVTFSNSGLMAVKNKVLFDLLSKVDNDNAAGEYYLTAVPELARAQGLSATAIPCDEAETLGVNSRVDLAAAEAAFQARTRQTALEDGVTMQAPETVVFAYDTVIGRDVVIEPNVVFGPGVTVETGAHIRAFSHLEGCHVSRGAIVGPYARLRPGAELSEDVRIGNFVEVKNAQLAEGAKVNHLSYIGDATVGKSTNIGAGTITCNYDGVLKHQTTIGERAFIGSNTMLVAPVTIGDEALTASGSVITKDVPEGALAVARGTQSNKPGLARKLMDRLRAIKAAKQKG